MDGGRALGRDRGATGSRWHVPSLKRPAIKVAHHKENFVWLHPNHILQIEVVCRRLATILLHSRVNQTRLVVLMNRQHP